MRHAGDRRQPDRGLTPARAPARAGFTMIEILVVVVISLLIASIALPSFSRAIQAQRLHTSARTVVTAHKYARNMAVLRQTPMAVLFDRLNGEVEVVALASRESGAGRNMFLDARNEDAKVVSAPGEKEEDEKDKLKLGIETTDMRMLERDVKISDYSSDGDTAERDGVYWVNYYPSGMSDGFVLKLQDERHRAAQITADSISGGITVEYE